MAQLVKVLFKDFITLQRGFDLPNGNRINGQYPVVASTTIQGCHSEFKVQPPGVTTGRSGSLGTVLYIDQPFWPLNTTLWVKDFKGNFPKYVYYFLKTLNLARWNAGSGVPTLNRNHLDNVQISIYLRPDQEKIATMLSAYDDLIENNTRRIKILEEMAQRIYREWFVDFRFPVHDRVKMVDSELGKIPEGWVVKKLIDLCEIVMGQSPKSEFYNLEGNGLPFHQGVTNFGENFPQDHIYCTVENRIGESGDILFSVRAPVGRINIADKKMVIGRGLSAIRSRKGMPSFVYFQLKDKFKEEDSMGGGTIFKAVTKADMHGIKMLMPNDDTVVQQFEGISNPIIAEIKCLTYKNTNLRQTRDLLMPKLISGELDVTNVEINTDRNA